MRRSVLWTTCFAAAFTLSAPALADHHESSPLESAISSELRSEDAVRDPHRHPAETLTFFGVEPGMSVADMMPSSGWYARILLPLLGTEGNYIGINPEIPEGATGFFASMANYGDTLPTQAQEWVGDDGAAVTGANIGSVPEELHGTVDRFLIFREIHNLRRMDAFHDVMVSARALLKDDGMIGVVQHRANADAPADFVVGNHGYQREQDVIGLFGAYGFELVARSEINANSKDPADWEGGVWSLPPGLRGAREEGAERTRREAIGESDRMTLLFRKRP